MSKHESKGLGQYWFRGSFLSSGRRIIIKNYYSPKRNCWTMSHVHTLQNDGNTHVHTLQRFDKCFKKICHSCVIVVFNNVNTVRSEMWVLVFAHHSWQKRFWHLWCGKSHTHIFILSPHSILSILFVNLPWLIKIIFLGKCACNKFKIVTQMKNNLCHSSDLEQPKNYWQMTNPNLIWLKNFMIQWASLHAFNYLMHMSGIQYLDEVRYFLCFHSIISVIVAICTIYVLMKYWDPEKGTGLSS